MLRDGCNYGDVIFGISWIQQRVKSTGPWRDIPRCCANSQSKCTHTYCTGHSDPQKGFKQPWIIQLVLDPIQEVKYLDKQEVSPCRQSQVPKSAKGLSATL